MINCIEEQDGSFTITWDENDPYESMFNTWTEQDFIDAIVNHCKEVLGQSEECPPEAEDSLDLAVDLQSPSEDNHETLPSGS